MSANETGVYERGDWTEGFRHLVREVSAMARLQGKNFTFTVHSMKFAYLISTAVSPRSPRSVLVRRRGEFALGYTAETPWGSPELDQQAAVIRTERGTVLLEENGLILTPHEFAVKLVDLIAT